MEATMKNPMQFNRLVGQWIQILCALQDFHHIRTWLTDGGHAARA